MQKQRPCEGDHTQHPSGTAEQDTLRTWISVNASITLGRKVREQKGAWVRALERFNIVVTKAAAIKSAAQLLKETCLGGGGMKNHGNQQTAAGWTIGVSVLKAGTGR